MSIEHALAGKVMRSAVTVRPPVSTVLDRGSRSDRPRNHAHTRWTPPLPLASTEPRRTTRRAGSQLITSQWKPATTAINQYSQDAVVDTGETLSIDLCLRPMTLTSTLSTASYGHDPYTCKNLSQRQVGSTDGVKRNGQTKGRTRPTAAPCLLMRS